MSDPRDVLNGYLNPPLVAERPLAKVTWSQGQRFTGEPVGSALLTPSQSGDTMALTPGQSGYTVAPTAPGFIRLGAWALPHGRGWRDFAVDLAYADVPDLQVFLTRALADHHRRQEQRWTGVA